MNEMWLGVRILGPTTWERCRRLTVYTRSSVCIVICVCSWVHQGSGRLLRMTDFSEGEGAGTGQFGFARCLH